ncbi:hypothetical protein QWZ13_15145 [Reinekea marina]|uniref:hypothetical protein n=1 Tax=Reinekea marina TaxID=1310421 RepID=UPI0025B3B398|nr:hypothetical protein [Reinekea marina]MDN3650252.1 hypothetical protein [Reinekea marina]
MLRYLWKLEFTHEASESPGTESTKTRHHFTRSRGVLSLECAKSSFSSGCGRTSRCFQGNGLPIFPH